MTVLDVVDEPAHVVAIREILVPPYAQNRLPHGVVDVAERAEGVRWVVARLRRDLRAECRFVDAVQTAVGVMHQDHFAGVEDPLREDERAQHVIGHQAAGIPQNMRFTRVQTEDAEVIDARVHARDDGDVLRRNNGPWSLEICFVRDGYFEKFINRRLHNRQVRLSPRGTPLYVSGRVMR